MNTPTMNTEQKQVGHTPGPWTFTDEPSGFFVYPVEHSDNSPAIAKVWKHATAPVRSKSHAQLIAAAPDLLSACNWAMSQLARFRSADVGDLVQQHWDDESEDTMRKLSAAIGRAEGSL